MSNNWSQPPIGYQPGENNKRVPHTGNLLQNPQQPGQPINQFSPINIPARRSEPLSNGQLPPGQGNASQPLAPGRVPTQGLLSAARRQGLLSNAMQMVRNISGKVVAINRPQIAAPPDPLVRYHPPVPDLSTPLPKPKPWKRSNTVRLSMRIRHRRKRTEAGSKKMSSRILIALAALLIAFASSGTAYGFAYYQSQQPQLAALASKHISQVTRIYDRNGTLLANIFDHNGPGRRTSISYDDIPQVMKDAMIAAEDQTFWNNGGVDPSGLLRAVIYGGSKGGGSTITQQLIKNMRQNGDQLTWQRKLSEAALAIGLTQQYSKTKILEMYFNISPFGATELGVETAAEDYFGLTRTCDKNFQCTPAVSKLDYDPATKKHSPLLALTRASLLAAMPNNPSLFDPGTWSLNSNNKDMALGRQIYVLDNMRNMGILEPGLGPNGQPGPVTPAIEQQVEKMTLTMKFHSYVSTTEDPAFVGWVVDQLKVALGGGNTDADLAAGTTTLLNGGFNIRTTIDSNLEKYVEGAVKRHLTEPEYQKLKGYVTTLSSPQFNVKDAAVVVMNAKTGEILAMDGSLDYRSTDPETGGQLNMAASPRQPGSSFKPIEYATAFEMGWYPGLVIPDVGTYFPNGAPPGMVVPPPPLPKANPDPIYTPPDYGGGIRGRTTINTITNNVRDATIRKATANSFNIPATRALTYAGINNVVATAQRMGITTVSCQNGACNHLTSLALGTKPIPLLQMVNAYQTFANNGRHVSYQGILDIWDNYGHQLYHFDPAHIQSAQILSPQVSYMMTSVLDDEVARQFEFTGDHDLSFWDWNNCSSYYVACNEQHQVAAKTGTTDNFRDNWTVGYTPDVVTGVWVGNANDAPFGQEVIGITGAAPIWHSVMERVSGRPCADINADDQIPCNNINLNSLGLGQQSRFQQPSGIHQQCVNNINGLMGTGGSCDWMIDGQDPVQAGLLTSDLNGSGNGSNGNGNNNGGGHNGHGGKKNGG
ncbi:MAG: transglycosylase domain-containing protein [Ktedonobacteraceae bacterium]|nr:transglycosylase domain-containing protein [Ktedonobacteraceae bacterium]